MDEATRRNQEPAAQPPEPRVRRIVAGVGLWASGLMLVGTLVAVTFAQILPAIFVFSFAVSLGAFSAAAYFVEPPDEDEPYENEPEPARMPVAHVRHDTGDDARPPNRP